MSAQSAMGTLGNGKWEPLSDLTVNEWFLLKDELSSEKVNDSTSKLTKYEIAEQVLHDIEDLGRNNFDYWLDEFPLFDEIQRQKSSEESKSKCEEKIQNFDFGLDQEPPSPKDVFAVSDIHKQSSGQQDLFSIADEDIATFILSNDNVFYTDDNEPILSFSPVQQECQNIFEYNEKTEEKTASEASAEKEDLCFYPDARPGGEGRAEDKREMTVMEEILKNTAMELDQWESDTSRSEMSSDGMTSAYSSPKARGEEEELDDPDWRPDSSVSEGRKHVRRSRSKPYWRSGSEEERKLRKKEQNKNAATRYRQKKKAEVCEILKEEELLKEKKAKLEERVADIQSEIKYLKPLMRELFRAKGMIK